MTLFGINKERLEADYKLGLLPRELPTSMLFNYLEPMKHHMQCDCDDCLGKSQGIKETILTQQDELIITRAHLDITVKALDKIVKMQPTPADWFPKKMQQIARKSLRAIGQSKEICGVEECGVITNDEWRCAMQKPCPLHST